MRFSRYSKKPIDPLDELPHLNGSLAITTGRGSLDFGGNSKQPPAKPQSPFNPVLKVRVALSSAPKTDVLVLSAPDGNRIVRRRGKLLTSHEYSERQKRQAAMDKIND